MGNTQKMGERVVAIAAQKQLEQDQKISDDEIANQITRQMSLSNRKYKCIKRLILIGPKSSGKSTLFQQMKELHGAEIPKSTATFIQKTCYLNALSLCVLVNADNKFKDKLNTLSIDNDDDLEKIANIISTVWKQKNVEKMYMLRHIYKYNAFGVEMEDNMDYFFNNINKIMSIKYEPTFNDWRRCHIHSNYPQTLQYEVKEYMYSLIDIPSYFVEIDRFRKKGYFLDIDFYKQQDLSSYHIHYNFAFIFVAALSDYCMYRENGNNALLESMDIFATFINHKAINGNNILFLNKCDLFRQRIAAGIPLSECFDGDENGKNETKWVPLVEGIGNIKLEMAVSGFLTNITKDYKIESVPMDIIQLIQEYVNNNTLNEKGFTEYVDNAIQYIQDRFVGLYQYPTSQIFCHITNATDTACVGKVMWDSQNVLIRSSLRLL